MHYRGRGACELEWAELEPRKWVTFFVKPNLSWVLGSAHLHLRVSLWVSFRRGIEGMEGVWKVVMSSFYSSNCFPSFPSPPKSKLTNTPVMFNTWTSEAKWMQSLQIFIIIAAGLDVCNLLENLLRHSQALHISVMHSYSSYAIAL